MGYKLVFSKPTRKQNKKLVEAIIPKRFLICEYWDLFWSGVSMAARSAGYSSPTRERNHNLTVVVSSRKPFLNIYQKKNPIPKLFSEAYFGCMGSPYGFWGLCARMGAYAHQTPDKVDSNSRGITARFFSTFDKLGHCLIGCGWPQHALGKSMGLMWTHKSEHVTIGSVEWGVMSPLNGGPTANCAIWLNLGQF